MKFILDIILSNFPIRSFFAKNVLPNITRGGSGRGSALGTAEEGSKESTDDNSFIVARDHLAVELLRNLPQLEAEQPGKHGQI